MNINPASELNPTLDRPTGIPHKHPEATQLARPSSAVEAVSTEQFKASNIAEL